MLARIHNRFGTAGLLIAIVALVAALGGSAVAALPGLNSKQKKEVSKIVKKVARVPGPQGLAGSAGTKGDPGATGINGTNGLSPTGVSFAGDQHGCTNGGVELKGANTTYVCNGDPGPTETTLPSGKVLKGLWQFQVNSPSLGIGLVMVNFPLRVEPSPDEYHWIGAGEGPTEECPGSAAEPKAKAGHLCLYVENLFNASSPPAPLGADGTLGWRGEFFLTDPTEEAFGFGSWAVTAK